MYTGIFCIFRDNTRQFLLFLVCIVGFFSAYTLQASAQVVPGGVHLVTEPSFPGAYSEVTVRLDDYAVDTLGATIHWYVDGKERVDTQNDRQISLLTGDIGKSTVVRAVLVQSNDSKVEKSITIRPVDIDIIIEADTYVPDFYRGRALPSTESRVRVIALVHDGANTPESSYTYRWREGGSVLFGGPLKGKNIIEYTMPRFDDKYLSVSVFDASGKQVGEKSVPLATAEPELHFYEYSALRGHTQRSIDGILPLIAEETTIYAEPYFVRGNMTAQDVSLTWKINGATTPSDSETPNAITLRKVGGAGEARVDFSAITKTHIPQFIDGMFKVVFN